MTSQPSPNPLTQFLSVADGADLSGRRSVDRILDAVRSHLGMDVAFASEIRDGQRILRHISAKDPNFPVQPGESHPLDESYCQRVLDGRLPQLIIEAAALPEAAMLPITAAMPIGSHLNVPLRLSDGSLYGTFCCFSHNPDFSLTERDLLTMRAFADLAVDQIEEQVGGERERAATSARIGAIIEGDALNMVFQPICGLADGRPVGVEALARFPDCELRPPCAWFAEAAEIGMGVELELLAVRAGLRALPFLPDHLYLGINASPATVLSGELEAIFAEAPAGRVVLEVTEHSEAADFEALRAALAPLRKHCRLAIDDVGAGYSGLRRILDLSPDLIKLDMSLTRNIDCDEARRVLAQALVAFAAGIDCRIVAEGIETAAELEALSALGVDYGQGYHLGRPLPLVASVHMLIGAGRVADEVPPPSFLPGPEPRLAAGGE